MLEGGFKRLFFTLRLNNEASQSGIAIHGCRYCKTKKQKRGEGWGRGEERKNLATQSLFIVCPILKKGPHSVVVKDKFLPSGLSRSRFPIDPIHAFARFELATNVAPWQRSVVGSLKAHSKAFGYASTTSS